MNIDRYIKRAGQLVGIDISRARPLTQKYPDFEPEFFEIYEACRTYTMTSIERMYSLYKAVEYVVKNNIPGDIVEAGVWRGGSCMLIAKTLQKFGDTERRIFLYDTFKGMPAPTAQDKQHDGERLQKRWDANIESNHNDWCYASLEDVKKNIASTSYASDKTIFVQGRVEETIPDTIPSHISLLRLDTDWYESTAHEMKHLYPLLQTRGVLIIDDYGHWKGSRQAVDEYIASEQLPLLLARVDYTGRIGVKT